MFALYKVTCFGNLEVGKEWATLFNIESFALYKPAFEFFSCTDKLITYRFRTLLNVIAKAELEDIYAYMDRCMKIIA